MHDSNMLSFEWNKSNQAIHKAAQGIIIQWIILQAATITAKKIFQNSGVGGNLNSTNPWSVVGFDGVRQRRQLSGTFQSELSQDFGRRPRPDNNDSRSKVDSGGHKRSQEVVGHFVKASTASPRVEKPSLMRNITKRWDLYKALNDYILSL